MSRVERVGVVHPEGGRVMTKQSMALESDINQIVARHVAHGVPFPAGLNPTYGDFSDHDGYHAALSDVMRAQHEFSRLPAAVREHCQNDPGEFLRMVYDPSRRGELEKLGLVEAAAPAAAPPADSSGAPEVVPPVVAPVVP